MAGASSKNLTNFMHQSNKHKSARGTIGIAKLGASHGSQDEISYQLTQSAASSQFQYSLSQFSSDPHQQSHKFMNQQRRPTVSAASHLAEEPIEELIDESRDNVSPDFVDARRDPSKVPRNQAQQLQPPP